MTPRPFTTMGKEVLAPNGTHYADACSNKAAEVIAEALNERRATCPATP